MKAYLGVNVECPGCKAVMEWDETRTTMCCRNSFCEFFGKKWKRPNIEIELVPEKEKDVT
jgi:hypothetical protein